MTETNPFYDLPEPEQNPFYDLPEPQAPRTLSESVWRGTKLAARMLAETPFLTAAGLADLASKGINVGISALDKAGQAIGDKPLEYRLPTDRAATIYQGFSDMGFPEPGETEEKFGRFVAGAGIPIKAGQMMQQSASPVTRGVGEALSMRPGRQGAGAVTAAAAGTAAKEMGAGPGTQLAVEMVGGGAPDVARYGAGAATRRVGRGPGGAERVRGNIDAFERVGTEPTVAQAGEGRFARANEGAMSRTPGGAGRITSTAEQQANDVRDFIEQRADQLAGRRTTAQSAGETIERGIRGDDGFINYQQEIQRELYDRLETLVPDEVRAPVIHTADVLEEMTRIIPGAERVSREISNSAIERIYARFLDDMAASNDGRMPFVALLELRKMVGQKLGSVSLVDEIPKAQWKRLYGALTQDLEVVMGREGPEAQQAWSRANTHTRALHNRIDRLENVLKRKGGPEKIYTATMAGTKEGATTLRAVMQSLNREEQRILTATVMRRMGRATAGKQDDLGEVFSMETFLTNWNGLSNEAKRVLFDRYGPTFRADMDAIARVAANVREGSQVFRNPSGTAQAATQNTMIGAFGMALLTGSFKTAAAIGSIPVLANLNARLITNPRFVRWLATNAETPIQQLPVQLNILAQEAAETGDRDLAYAVALMEQEL